MIDYYIILTYSDKEFPVERWYSNLKEARKAFEVARKDSDPTLTNAFLVSRRLTKSTRPIAGVSTRQLDSFSRRQF